MEQNESVGELIERNESIQKVLSVLEVEPKHIDKVAGAQRNTIG